MRGDVGEEGWIPTRIAGAAAEPCQRGVALFICLALLLVLGIAGASGVRMTILEERMARNAGDALVAFEAAEAALRDAEEWLADSLDGTGHFTDAGTNGLWTAARLGETERWAIPGVWEPGNGTCRSAVTHIGLAAVQPRFIIEWIATLRDAGNPHLVEESPANVEERVEVFRITALGMGRTVNARAMVQSTFGVRF